MLKWICLKLYNYKWRMSNKHNYTKAISLFPIEMCKCGKQTYGNLDLKVYNKNLKLTIGNYCSIADNVTFLMGGEHDYKRISTYPFQSLIYKIKTDCSFKENIIIEDDVWIGYDSLILSGTHIGKGSVIGARSVVKGNIPPYSVYIGNRVVKKRFTDEIIDKLMDIDFSKICHEKNDSYRNNCQDTITNENVDDIIKHFIS